MKLLMNRYMDVIRKNCTDPGLTSENSVTYWRNHYFSNTVAVIIPLSLITVIPGVVFTLHLELYTVAFLDFLSFLGLVYIGFGKGICLETRKMIFMGIAYFAAAFLLYYIGIAGPGVLFLYAACVFGILILNKSYAYLWSVINIAICALFALIVHFNLSSSEAVNNTTVGEWAAISANLIFLSLLTSAMLPGIFTGLSKTVRKQIDLQQELIAQTKSLEQSVQVVEQKNEELEKFAYIISHDLQEPLRMITGFLSQLDHKYGDQLDDKARQYIEFASGGARRMREILFDLLEYSRIGRADHQTEKINLAELLEDYRSLRKRLISESRTTIQLETPDSIFGYKVPFTQIVYNLLDNAIKYARKEVAPIVKITLSPQNGHWRIAVQDNGIGIEEEYFERIFTVFQRLHAANEYNGNGVGLAIVKKTLSTLGGTIRVESELNKGSTFYVEIPRIRDDQTV